MDMGSSLSLSLSLNVKISNFCMVCFVYFLLVLSCFLGELFFIIIVLRVCDLCVSIILFILYDLSL